MKKALKTRKKLKKTEKNSEKKLQIFFCLGAFTREEKISLIKKACFILNFLNFKSFPSYLFFVVASSLSIICPYCPLAKKTFFKNKLSLLCSSLRTIYSRAVLNRITIIVCEKQLIFIRRTVLRSENFGGQVVMWWAKYAP